MGGCCNGCELEFKSEFKKAHFLLNHHEHHRFWQSEWHPSQKSITLWYLLYRLFWGAWHLIWCILGFFWVNDEVQFGGPFVDKFYFFIYLTNWSYVALTVCTVYHAVLATIMFLRYRSSGSMPANMLNSTKVLWVLQNVTSFPAIFITAAYWSLLYDPNEGPVDVFNAVFHMVNSVYVLIELGVSAWPVRILHFIYPLAFAMSYVVFSLIYYLTGGLNENDEHYVYPFLDFENLGYTIPFICGGFLSSPILQTLVWLLHKARINAVRAILGQKHSTEIRQPPSTVISMEASTTNLTQDDTTLHV